MSGWMNQVFSLRAGVSKSAGLFSTALAAAPLLSQAAVTQERPNILFILADDHGPDGVGCYGGATYAGCTPRLDDLAANGLRFTRCYAQPTCSPSRAQYLTGQYPFRNGVIVNDGCNARFDPVKPCLTKVLHDAGYTTGGSGKSVDDSFYSYFNARTGVSEARDFMDEYLSAGSGDYVDVKKFKFKGPSSVKPADYPYFPDAMQAFALDFIRRNRPTPENGNKPFYLYYSLIHPHAPLLPTPDSVPARSDGKMTNQEMYRDYVRYIDKMVGELVDELAALGQLDNTLIVYSGDNGCWGFGLQGTLPDPQTGEQRSISGGKSDEWELRDGTALVPLIIHWPAVVKKPEVRNDLVDFTDFLTTFADVAGADLPPEWIVDGHSFAPLLRGVPDWMPKEQVYVQLQFNWCLRGPQFRLNRDGRLFDMSDAPFSMTEIRPENDTTESAVARKALQAVLNGFDPESGVTYESTQDYYYHGGRKFYYMGKQRVPYEDSAANTWSWKTKHFSSGKNWDSQFSGDLADPDKDGVPNIFERAFGWDPNNGSDRMPKPGPGGEGVPPVVNNSGISVTTVEENGELKLKAIRAISWPTPLELVPSRPDTVR